MFTRARALFNISQRRENNHIKKKSAQTAFERSWWTLQYHPQRKEWDSEFDFTFIRFPLHAFSLSRHCRARFAAGDSHWQVSSRRCCRTLIIIYFFISMVYWCAAFTIAFYGYLRIFLIFSPSTHRCCSDRQCLSRSDTRRSKDERESIYLLTNLINKTKREIEPRRLIEKRRKIKDLSIGGIGKMIAITQLILISCASFERCFHHLEYKCELYAVGISSCKAREWEANAAEKWNCVFFSLLNPFERIPPCVQASIAQELQLLPLTKCWACKESIGIYRRKIEFELSKSYTFKKEEMQPS